MIGLILTSMNNELASGTGPPACAWLGYVAVLPTPTHVDLMGPLTSTSVSGKPCVALGTTRHEADETARKMARAWKCIAFLGA
jgi:hypothetical protein